MDFEIKKVQSHYDIFLGSLRISTADTLHEAEQDVEAYEKIRQNYINTGSLPDWRAAILFRR